MDNSDLYISKANFILFKRENIANTYEFYPKVSRFWCRNLDEAHMELFTKQEKRAPRILGGQSKKYWKNLFVTPIQSKTRLRTWLVWTILQFSKFIKSSKMKIACIWWLSTFIYILSLCEGGELFDRLEQMGSFNEQDARTIFIQMLQAINYCHK